VKMILTTRLIYLVFIVLDESFGADFPVRYESLLAVDRPSAIKPTTARNAPFPGKKKRSVKNAAPDRSRSCEHAHAAAKKKKPGAHSTTPSRTSKPCGPQNCM
jgi:hypothetical protein